jgi:hypothetical protein
MAEQASSDHSAKQDQTVARHTLELPHEKVHTQAMKLCIKLFKAIDYYFYQASFRGEVEIIVYEGDKIIFKSEEEHTSPILNIYGSENCYLIVTENTIYILHKNLKIKTK